MFHKRLLAYFVSCKKQILKIALYQWGMLLLHVLFYYCIANVLVNAYQRELTTFMLLRFSIIVIVIVMAKYIIQKNSNTTSFQLSFYVKGQLRQMIFKKVMQLGTHYQSYISTSKLVQISCEGVEQLEIYFSRYLPQFIYSLLAPLTLFFLVALIDFKVAIILFICVPLIPISIIVVQKIAKRLLSKYWKNYATLGNVFLENIKGLVTLKVYQADARYAHKMELAFESFRNMTMRVLFMQLNSISVMDFIAYGGSALGIALTIIGVQQNHIGLFGAFFIIMVSAEFFLPMRLLGSYFHIAMNGHEAANSIFQFMDAEIPPQGEMDVLSIDELHIQQVSFAYTQKKVLNNINFVVSKRSLIGIVGESGCGKSTLASLIRGKYIPQQGRIMINNENITHLTNTCLHRHITYVGAHEFIFSDSVRMNLCLGNPLASDEQLLDVLKQVNMYEVIMEKGGLDSVLVENGNQLSGGQKQRFVLARALLKDSDMYIFDEATSNIDKESEDHIVSIIHQLSKTKMVIFISHRLENVKEANCIYFMDKGVCTERGTHEDLFVKRKSYYNMYVAQKNMERIREGQPYEKA